MDLGQHPHAAVTVGLLQIGCFWPKNHTQCTPVPGFWPDIHMSPLQGVQAHLDLQGQQASGVLLPIHWGTFNLSVHPWAEPGEWTKAAADAVGQAVALPVPGQPFEPSGHLPTDPWWRGLGGLVERKWPVPEIPAPAVPEKSGDDLDLVGDI